MYTTHQRRTKFKRNFSPPLQVIPNVVLPTTAEIVGFNTRRRDGNMSLRCEIDSQLRSFDVKRDLVISLFNIHNPTQNLLPLANCLPKHAVIHVNGLQIEEMTLFQTKKDAQDHFITLTCFSEEENDFDGDNFNTLNQPAVNQSDVTGAAHHSQSPQKRDESKTAKKKLSFHNTEDYQEENTDNEMDERDSPKNDQINEKDCLKVVNDQ